MEEFFRHIPLPKLQKEHLELMDQIFTETEIMQAIKSLNPSKSTGPRWVLRFILQKIPRNSDRALLFLTRKIKYLYISSRNREKIMGVVKITVPFH